MARSFLLQQLQLHLRDSFLSKIYYFFLNLAKVPHTYVNPQPSFERRKSKKHFPEDFSSRPFLVNFNHTSLVRFLYFNCLMNGVSMTTGDECDDLNQLFSLMLTYDFSFFALVSKLLSAILYKAFDINLRPVICL